MCLILTTDILRIVTFLGMSPFSCWGEGVQMSHEPREMEIASEASQLLSVHATSMTSSLDSICPLVIAFLT